MRFHIENMTCGGCARSVAKAVEAVDPKARIEADPVTKKATVDTSLPSETISRVLSEAGYPATAVD
jgi:copper chaperone